MDIVIGIVLWIFIIAGFVRWARGRVIGEMLHLRPRPDRPQ